MKIRPETLLLLVLTLLALVVTCFLFASVRVVTLTSFPFRILSANEAFRKMIDRCNVVGRSIYDLFIFGAKTPLTLGGSPTTLLDAFLEDQIVQLATSSCKNHDGTQDKSVHNILVEGERSSDNSILDVKPQAVADRAEISPKLYCKIHVEAIFSAEDEEQISNFAVHLSPLFAPSASSFPSWNFENGHQEQAQQHRLSSSSLSS